MFRTVAAAALAASFVVLSTGVANADEGKGGGKTTLKLATLAPKSSPWGKVFKRWAEVVDKKTDGKVEIVWQWNGTAGDETAVVGKIKGGQLAGAAITAVGLSAIYKPVLALQFPGVFSKWADLDKARDLIRDDTEKAMKDAGFYVGGFGDVGVGRVMSNGFVIKVPQDLKGKKPAMIREDIIAPKVYEAIGGVTPVPGAVTDFLPGLNSKNINVMNTPSLAAEQLQWASKLDHMNTNATYYGMGAMVMSQAQLDKMTADQKEKVTETGKIANKQLRGSIRGLDEEAFQRLKKRMTVHEPSEAEKAEWKKVFNKACKNLKSAMPGDVLTKIGAC